MAFSNAHFGAGIGSTFLDDVICSGSETSLLDCSRATTVYCYTGHSEDAGVRCYSKIIFGALSNKARLMEFLIFQKIAAFINLFLCIKDIYNEGI